MRRTADLIVVGAGTMGAWTAYWAQTGGPGQGEDGAARREVILLDAWGAGHSRATSGDETRIIRSAHGKDTLYTRWAERSREHWRRLEVESGVRLFLPAGVLWFAHREGGFEDDSAATFAREGIPHERLGPDELTARWPQLGTEGGLRFALYEPGQGALMARRGCQVVTAAFQRSGGSYALAAVRPGRSEAARLTHVEDRSGRRWSADSFVFACGPWLPRLFPDVLAELIRVTKQDVLFVGPPPGDRRFHADALPAWADYDAAYYGVPAADERGFKIAPDRYGPVFDPSNGDRVVDPESVRLVRQYLRQRFPDLAAAPVVETRVCQYESTPDAHFVIDRHPRYENVWIAGGGSGHGFKHGPRIGEYLAARLNGASEGDQDGPEEARFRIGPRSPAHAARTGGDEMASTWDLF
ncbi:MAG: FAD-dependent oxidoreductase [Chloroflexota bacterium]|nr:FAD-dependent oxidoreductase [Chloroflexota bacterium]